jgi:hypothetical protein
MSHLHPDEPVLNFAGMTPALWEELVPQAWQDKFLTRRWEARVWMRMKGLLPARRQRPTERPQEPMRGCSPPLDRGASVGSVAPRNTPGPELPVKPGEQVDLSRCRCCGTLLAYGTMCDACRHAP